VRYLVRCDTWFGATWLGATWFGLTWATTERAAAADRTAVPVDGYQQLGQPERWSRSRSSYFHWYLDAFLLSIALERVTIERFMLARVVAAAVVWVVVRVLT
jgi:hypothetical protein